VQWPDDVTGLNGQVVLAILDGSGAVIARTAAIGPLTTAGSSFPASMGAATYTPGPFQGTVLVRMSAAPCSSPCAPITDFCAPGGVSAGPACKALPDLSGPYLAEISRAITFN
jgi:hypothetical protein